MHAACVVSLHTPGRDLYMLCALVCSSLLSAAPDPCTAGVVRTAAQTRESAAADVAEQEISEFLAGYKESQDTINKKFEKVRHCLHCMP